MWSGSACGAARAFSRPADKSPPSPRKTRGPTSGPATSPVVTAPMLTMGWPLKMGGNASQYLTDSVAGTAELGADAARYLVSPEVLHRMLAHWSTSSPARPWAGCPPPGKGHRWPATTSPSASRYSEFGLVHVGHGGPGHPGGYRGAHGEGPG